MQIFLPTFRDVTNFTKDQINSQIRSIIVNYGLKKAQFYTLIKLYNLQLLVQLLLFIKVPVKIIVVIMIVL